MATTTVRTPRFEVAVDPMGLGEASTLAFVVERRRRQDEAAAEEMRAVAHWADLHRVEGEEIGSVDADLIDVVFPTGDADQLLGREGELRLAGQAAFRVTEFAVCELAAALGVSEPAARAQVGQTVELRDRLPRLWAGVMGARLPAWKARKIAEQTIPLTAAAADYVDRQLAPFAHKLSLVRITRAVDAAILRHDPDLAAERAAKAAERRGVWMDERAEGLSEIRAVTDTPDAVALDTALTQVAAALHALGDEDPEQVRRARAVGVLADPQYALDLRAAADHTGAATQVVPRRSGQRPTVHVHLHTEVLTGAGEVARVEGFGAQSLATIERWLTGLTPGAHVTLTPVVDLTDHISVDAYEAPDRLRAQVDERDDGCRFPWCGRRGRYDLDHIDPYVPVDDGGPPGQTSTANLAKLCRFHHRVKTHGDWTYRRDPDGVSLTWTSPLGRAYTVDQHGTLPRA